MEQLKELIKKWIAEEKKCFELQKKGEFVMYNSGKEDAYFKCINQLEDLLKTMEMDNKEKEQEKSIVDIAREYAIKCHRDTNHKYDGQWYDEAHLLRVYNYGAKYQHLLPPVPTIVEQALAACWTHDTIEDARQTYNDVMKVCGFTVAEITRALTNYGRGRNRRERMPDYIYEEIAKTPYAIFVKLCDRLANVSYASEKWNMGMLSAYRSENEHFKAKLYYFEYKEMFDELENLLYPIKLTTPNEKP